LIHIDVQLLGIRKVRSTSGESCDGRCVFGRLERLSGVSSGSQTQTQAVVVIVGAALVETGLCGVRAGGVEVGVVVPVGVVPVAVGAPGSLRGGARTSQSGVAWFAVVAEPGTGGGQFGGDVRVAGSPIVV
jgi:hypothetical protein